MKHHLLQIRKRKLAAYLLNLAADKFQSHSCNDLDEEIWEGWTMEDRKELISEYYKSIDEPQEAEEGHTNIEDFVLMRFLADELEK